MARVDTLESGDAFRSWLFRIARNASVDWHRRNQRLQPMPEDAPETVPSPVDGPDERVETQEEHQMVAEALSTLKESHQKVLVLREVEGMSYADIARRMNVSQSAVETLLFRARRRLREQYGKAAFARIGAFAPIRMLAGRVSWPFATGVPVAAKVAVTAALVGTTAFTISHGAGLHKPAHLHGNRPVLSSVSAMGRAAQPSLQHPKPASLRRTRAAHVRRRVVRSVSGAAAPVHHARHHHARPSAPVVVHHRLSVHVIHPPQAAHTRAAGHARRRKRMHLRVAHPAAPGQKRSVTEPRVQDTQPVASAVHSSPTPSIQRHTPAIQPSRPTSSGNSSTARGTTASPPSRKARGTLRIRHSGTAHGHHAQVDPASSAPKRVVSHPAHRAHRHTAPPGGQSSPQTGNRSAVAPAQNAPAHATKTAVETGHRHHHTHGSASNAPSPTPSPTSVSGVAVAAPAPTAPPADAVKNGQAGPPPASNGQGNGAAASNGQGNGTDPSSPQSGNQPSGGNNSGNGVASGAGQANPHGTPPGQANRPSTNNGGAASQPTPNPQPTHTPGSSTIGKKP